MADRKITELSAMSAGGQATGDLVTIVDVSEAAAADKNKKMTMENLFKGIPGDVGIGTSTPATKLEVNCGTDNAAVEIVSTDARVNIGFADNSTTLYSGLSGVRVGADGDNLAAYTANNERLRIDSSGRLLIGATSSSLSNSAKGIVVEDSAVAAVRIGRTGGTASALQIESNNGISKLDVRTNTPLAFHTNQIERMRIDSSGRLLVGHSSSRSVGAGSAFPAKLQIESSGFTNTSFVNNTNDEFGPEVNFGKSRGTSAGSNTVVQSGDQLGIIQFAGADGTDLQTNGAAIECRVDGTPGSNDMPGRLILATTADGASSPTERMRIDSSGNVGIGETSPDAKLHVTNSVNNSSTFGSNAAATLLVENSNSSGFANLKLANASNANNHAIVYGTTTSGSLRIMNNSAERMRIDSSGRLLVGTSSSIGTYLQQLSFAGAGTNGFIIKSTSTSADGSTALRISRNYAVNNTVPFISCGDTSATRFEARNNGGIANYQANNVNLSDRNVKKNINPAASTWDCIKEWEIVKYRYRDQPDDAVLNFGVIAQQVAESCPEVIKVFEEAKNDQPEKLGVKEQQMYWMAVKALQEAQARIETLEAKVAALEAQ